MILCWALLEYIEISRWLTPKANEMTTAVLLFLSLYYLISCSSEQLERIRLYRNNFNSLAKYFLVSCLYSGTIYWMLAYADLIQDEKKHKGPRGTRKDKLWAYYHTALKSVLNTSTCAAEGGQQIKTWIRLNVCFYAINDYYFFNIKYH